MGNCELNNVFGLIHLVLALPPTSVNNETAFSAMKLLKTERRGRLSSERLNDLMTIKLTSPDIEHFDPETVLNHWMVGICFIPFNNVFLFVYYCLNKSC